MATESKEWLRSLLSAGWTKSKISKKLGINSSTLSQIEKGKKPGRNLALPLQRLSETGEAGERAKRMTKGGEPAKVRQSKQATSSKRILETKDGRIKVASPTTLPHVAAKRLARIAADGGKVSIRCRVVTDSGERDVVLYGRGGEFAARLEHRWAVFQDQSLRSDFFDFVVELSFEILGNVAGKSQPMTREMLKAVGYSVIYPDRP